MNRLVIIGNGFDLAHDLHTSYKDFIDWYWRKWGLDLCNNHSRIAEDVLCRWELINTNPKEPITWHLLTYQQGFFRLTDPMIFKEQIETSPGSCIISKSLLLDRITKNIENKGWTDIESDYYELLKKHTNDIEKCQNLNNQLDFTREKLAEYLGSIEQPQAIDAIKLVLNEPVFIDDVSTIEINRGNEGLKSTQEEEFIVMDKNTDPTYDFVEQTMLLSFNYTPTAEMYLDETTHINYIHGSLDKPKEMIFGYGDEMDKDFQALIDRNENALLENSKSIKYLETSHYRKLLEFIEGGQFQVYIMGHSCGNSDRTLLNTIFEHQNCISIKPFCYINENNEDNYSELTRNIYRNFTDKKLFRDRVVNKERCTTLDGQPLVGKEQLASQ